MVYGLSDDGLLKWKSEQSSINAIPRLKTRALFIQSKEDPFSV